MRPSLLAVILLHFFATSVFGQKVGDRVVVTVSSAQLKSQNDVVGSVIKGNILTVREVNGEWLWVLHSGVKLTAKGWINRRDVIAYENALEFFDRELRQSPSADLYHIRGMIWDERGEFDIALRDFNEALRLDPTRADAWNSRGKAWGEKGDIDKAIADHTEAIRLDPQFAMAYANRAFRLIDKGELAKAMSDANEAVRLDPKYPFAYVARGTALLRKLDNDKAIDDYTVAIQLDPKQAFAYYHRGLLWHDKREYDKALADYNEVIRLDPRFRSCFKTVDRVVPIGSRR